MFEPRTYSDIFNAMQTSSTAAGVITDFSAGSVARTLSESFAYEMALLYQKMQLVYLAAYVDTATGQQLDQVVAILGMQRGEPDFAQGTVTFQGDVSKEDTVVPPGTLVATEDKPAAPKKVFQTVTTVTLSAGQTSVDARVQAVNRGETETAAAGAVTVMPRPIPGIKSVSNTAAITFTGKKAETDDQLRDRAKNALISSGKATVVAIENALLSLPGVTDAKVIEHFDVAQYGLIDVYADGVDLTDATEKANLTSAVDSVRAAGVFARLQAATALNVIAVLQIQTAPGVKLAADERAELESNVAGSVTSYINGLKMGDTLLMSQIIKNILAVENVTDLVKYAITVNGNAVFQDTARSLESQSSERFKPAQICAASEVKQLPIDIAFRATAGLTAASLTALTTAWTSYLAGLAAGTAVLASEVTNRISAAGIGLDPASLQITPHSWCEPTQRSGNDVLPKFVEQPALGKVFAYSSFLGITGAIRLTLSPQLTQTQQAGIQGQVRQAIQNVLAALGPESPVAFKDLIAAAKAVDQVQDAQINTTDFRLRLDTATTDLAGRVSDQQIEVRTFEKTRLDNFCITGAIRVVTITVTQLAVSVTVSGAAPTGPALDKVTTQITGAIGGKPLLGVQTPGQSVAYNNVVSAIVALVPSQNITVTGMTLSAISECDSRAQTAAAPGTSIHIRSVEVANLVAVDPGVITVTGLGTA